MATKFNRLARFLMTLVACCAVVMTASQLALTQDVPEPAPEHELLRKLVGTWEMEIDFWPLGPTGPKMSSTAVETSRMLGPFFVLADLNGEIGGIPFQGHSQTGFNSKEKKFFGTWCDVMNPLMTTMSGTYDPETKTLTMEYESIDPSTGEKTRGKNIDRFLDDDKRIFEMHGIPPGGTEIVKLLEGRYTRKSRKIETALP